MKIVFNITEQGAWVEIEQPDGTMKKWNEELTDSEYAQISAAGMMMLKGSTMRAMLSVLSSDAKNPKRLAQIEKHLNKAEELTKQIFGIE